MTKSKHFIIQELVPPETYKAMDEQAWQLIDEPMIKLLDGLREHFDRPVIINNWHTGGQFKYRGFRPKGCKVGKETGEHYKKPLNAVDFNVLSLSDDSVKTEILKHEAKFMALGLTRMESSIDAPTWTHVDRKPTGLNTIKVFRA